MYIIDESYFQSNLLIPNVNELNSTSLDVLEQFVDDKARLCLKKALGSELFMSLDGDITDGVLDGGAQQRWIDLVNGVEYTKNGTDYKWDGLIYTEGTKKHSLLAFYVYYFWLFNEQQKQTGVGTVVVNSKNATNVNATQTLVSAWNDFVTLYQHDCNYSYDSYYYDNIFFDTYWWMNDSTNYVSLLKFLSDNAEDYPDAALTRYNYKNSFGL